MAGLRDTLPPLSRTQVLLQTRTPRQDFLRMLTLWLLVLRIAHPLECLRASSHSAGYTKRQCPSGQSCQSSCSAICKETKENTVTLTQYHCHRSRRKCYKTLKFAALPRTSSSERPSSSCVALLMALYEFSALPKIAT